MPPPHSACQECRGFARYARARVLRGVHTAVSLVSSFALIAKRFDSGGCEIFHRFDLCDGCTVNFPEFGEGQLSSRSLGNGFLPFPILPEWLLPDNRKVASREVRGALCWRGEYGMA